MVCILPPFYAFVKFYFIPACLQVGTPLGV
nr:MAG TPA: hypothetical protein [Caudoviricetes sp.]